MKRAPLALTLLWIAFAGAAPARAAFHELSRFKLGGDGGWDALTVDADARRLYIARSNRVMVIDADAGTLVGEVSGLEGAHAVVILSQLGRGFASSGKTGELVAFDLKTLKVTDRVKVGDNPDLILYDPFSGKVIAFNGKGRSAVAVDPSTLKASVPLALPGKPEFAATDGAGRVFVNIEDKSELAVIDAKALTLTQLYPLTPCEEPTGLAIDGTGKALLVGCDKLAAVVDPDTGKVVQTFKAGDGIDGTAYDASRGLGFASAGEGLLTIIRKSGHGFKLLQQLKTVKGARTIALDPKTGHVFLPAAQFEAEAPAPAPAPGTKKARPKMVPGSFFVLVEGG